MKEGKVPIDFTGLEISDEMKKEVSDETQRRFGHFANELIEKKEKIEIISVAQPYSFIVNFDNIKDRDLKNRLKARMESKY